MQVLQDMYFKFQNFLQNFNGICYKLPSDYILSTGFLKIFCKLYCQYVFYLVKAWIASLLPRTFTTLACMWSSSFAIEPHSKFPKMRTNFRNHWRAWWVTYRFQNFLHLQLIRFWLTLYFWSCSCFSSFPSYDNLVYIYAYEGSVLLN